MIDENHTQSEQDIEKQMYSAMADHMQNEGVNTTAEDIAQAAEEQSSPPPPEASEKDAETMEQMAAYQTEHHQSADAYVVRGALLKCRHGSHCRRLNLPRSHGVYVLNHPIMMKTDCVAGTEGAHINVTTFGICGSPSNPNGGSVRLMKEPPRNPDGSFKETGGDYGTISGTPCVPEILGEWEGAHEGTHIGLEGQEALLTSSFLVCRYGGLIEIIRSGQDDSDE